MKLHYAIALCVAIAIICSRPVGAQQPGSSAPGRNDGESIRIDTSLVLLDGIVLNKRTKKVVGDLSKDDFSIFENDQRQEITHFSREELPLSVMLLLDVSGSIQPVIREVRDAALDALKNLKPQDKVALMIFANRTKLVTPLTGDRDSIRRGLDELLSSIPEVGNGTIITESVYNASRYLKERTTDTVRRAIILITDDEDFRYSVPPREVVLRELNESGATLCGILITDGKAGSKAADIRPTKSATTANPVQDGSLIGMKIFQKSSLTGTSRYFTDNTGGVLIASKKNEVGLVFIGIMQLLRTRYTFGYEPPEKPNDGQLRRIQLSVNESPKRKKSDLIVLTRGGYYYKPL